MEYKKELKDFMAIVAMHQLMKDDPNPWSVAQKAYKMAEIMLEVRENENKTHGQ